MGYIGQVRVIDSVSLPHIIACDTVLTTTYSAWLPTTIYAFWGPIRVANLRRAAKNTDYFIKCKRRTLGTIGKKHQGQR